MPIPNIEVWRIVAHQDRGSDASRRNHEEAGVVNAVWHFRSGPRKDAGRLLGGINFSGGREKEASAGVRHVYSEGAWLLIMATVIMLSGVTPLSPFKWRITVLF